jgi:hypothetical protein
MQLLHNVVWNRMGTSIEQMACIFTQTRQFVAFSQWTASTWLTAALPTPHPTNSSDIGLQAASRH